MDNSRKTRDMSLAAAVLMCLLLILGPLVLMLLLPFGFQGFTCSHCGRWSWKLWRYVHRTADEDGFMCRKCSKEQIGE